MANSVIEVTPPSLPKGGGALKGIGETFQAQEFTGTAVLSIPIPTTPSRGFEPHLSVDYSSGAGNGLFGLGWSLSVPSITRKTSKGTPRYDGRDTFLFNSEELVEIKNGRRQVPQDHPAYTVITYRPRSEGLFAKIERWVVKDGRDSYWRVISKDNVTSIFGASPQTRITDPADPQRIFQWLLQESYDAQGNMAVYEYSADSPTTVTGSRQESNHVQGANRYLQRIKYSNTPALTTKQWHLYEQLQFGSPPGAKDEAWAAKIQAELATKDVPDVNWHMQVVFDYGDHQIDPDAANPYTEPGGTPIKPRQDPFSTFHAGFEIRTRRLCHNILLLHHFPAELGAKPVLIHATRFHYEYHEISGIAQLKEVQSAGFRYTPDNGYTARKLPPLSFDYTPFAPDQAQFTPFLDDRRTSLPGLEGHPYQLVDLYGEGLPGVLYADGSSTFYWSPKGSSGRSRDGQNPISYAPPTQPNAFPLHRSPGSTDQRLIDLTGSGQLDLVVNTSGGPGYYQVQPDQSWQSFQALPNAPLHFSDPDGELLDFSGDGLSDLVRIELDRVQLYPGLGRDGFGAPQERPQLPGLPWPTHPAPDEAVHFADMFGTGGQHLVRVRRSSVECWPHLGYGRFAEPILIDCPPRFPQTIDPRRLFLVDLDGSGPTDMIYAHEDRVEIWFNQSGNCFTEQSRSFTLPAPCTSGSQLSFADVLGSGTMALIFSDNCAQPRHWFLDFSQGQKAYLLNKIDNHLGAATTITYSASTKFYLDDKRQGLPWLTRLPFPVQVVAKIETRDEISDTTLVNKFLYRHGYYDGEEREFRGFGLVERGDAEIFSAAADPTFVPPVITKTWYHTGASFRGGLAARFRPDYYAMDPQAAKLDDLEPDPSYAKMDRETLRQVHQALHGRILRQEVTSLDERGRVARHPYTVSESSYNAKVMQYPAAEQKAIIFVHPAQTIAYHYEQQPTDPRVEQNLTLQVDPYGHVQRSCHIYYPRRPSEGAFDQQLDLQVVAAFNEFINIDRLSADQQTLYWTGIPKEKRSYEIGGLHPKSDPLYLKPQEVNDYLDSTPLEPVNYEDDLDPDLPQSRLLSWRRYFYWNNPRTAFDQLIDQGIPSRWYLLPLLHHIEDAVLPDSLLESEQGPHLTNELLEDAGYHHQISGESVITIAASLSNPSEMAYWWKSSSTQSFYDRENFFLLAQTIDPFGAATTITYDDYKLVPTAVTDALGSTTQAAYDYHILQPLRITDSNNNSSEALFDPLGMVIATTVYGEENGRSQGDQPLSSYTIKDEANLEKLLARPKDFLQEASTFFYYDPFAYQERGQPACSVNLLREAHVHSDNALTAPGEKIPDQHRIQVHIIYSDGFGRIIQSKIKAGAGKAMRCTPGGHIVEEDVAVRWLSSGRTLYNNKGKAVKQYEPYFSATEQHEAEADMAQCGVTHVIHYDPLLRPVRVDSPEGFFTKAEFTPWQERHFDPNDTILESPFYQEQNGKAGLEPAVQDALDKAAKHAGTAETHNLDNLGRNIRILQELEGSLFLETFHGYDIQGRLRGSIDPRGNLLFEQSYDMTGAPLRTYSADAGERWMLANVLGRPQHIWDGRHFHISTTYDLLQRPLEIRVQDGDGPQSLDHIVQKMDYGTADLADQERNLCGRLREHYDEAGLTRYPAYDLLGSPRETIRALRRDYEGEANWDGDDLEALLEAETFTTSWGRDALGRPYAEHQPDGSTIRRSYNAQGGLEDMTAVFADGRVQRIVENIATNAKGQRTTIAYGNGVNTAYTYDPHNFRLKTLQSRRTSDQQQGFVSAYTSGGWINALRPKNGRAASLQDIAYTYDAVGNITQLRDASHQSVFSRQQQVSPLQKYTYDALYRLIAATGREHAALLDKDHLTTDPDSFQHSHFLNLNDHNLLRNYQEKFCYDPGGNLIRIQHTTGTSSASWTRNFQTADKSNRAILIDPSAPASQVDDYFDAHGNLKSLANARELRWNYHEMIARVTLIKRDGKADDLEYYIYDSQGRRVRKVTERLKAGHVEIAETIYLGGVEIRRVRRKNDPPANLLSERYDLHLHTELERVAIVHQWSAGPRKGERQIRYQLDNHLGSAALELNEQAEIISYEEYYPYGGTALIAGKDQTEVRRKSYRYSGKERDDSTGLYYYGARYYASWLGRWLNPDPAGTVDGLNLYAFVSGNPLKFIDHQGFGIFSACFGSGTRNRVDTNAQQAAPEPPPQPPARRLSARYQKMLATAYDIPVAINIPAVPALGIEAETISHITVYEKTPADYAAEAASPGGWAKKKIIDPLSKFLVGSQSPGAEEHLAEIRAGVSNVMAEAKKARSKGAKFMATMEETRLPVVKYVAKRFRAKADLQALEKSAEVTPFTGPVKGLLQQDVTDAGREAVAETLSIVITATLVAVSGGALAPAAAKIKVVFDVSINVVTSAVSAAVGAAVGAAVKSDDTGEPLTPSQELVLVGVEQLHKKRPGLPGVGGKSIGYQGFNRS